MKLDSKVDKSIKRYLKSISEDYTESKIYNSIHYGITVNGKLMDIRFSDHISDRGKKNTFLNIVKTGEDTYHIQFYYAISGNKSGSEALQFIKCLIIIGEELVNTLDILKTDITEKQKQIGTLTTEKNNALATIEFKNNEIVEANKRWNTMRTANNNANNTIQSLNDKLSKLEREKNSMIQQIKKIINS